LKVSAYSLMAQMRSCTSTNLEVGCQEEIPVSRFRGTE